MKFASENEADLIMRRLVLILVCFLSWRCNEIKNNPSPTPGVLTHAYTPKRLIQLQPHDQFRQLETQSVLAENGKFYTIQLIVKIGEVAYVIDNDTLRNDLFDAERLPYVDSVSTYAYPLRVYYEDAIDALLNQPDTKLRKHAWLFIANTLEPDSTEKREIYNDRRKLFSAEIFPLQLDDDIETERIIETFVHLSTRYFICDKQNGYWKIVDVIALHDAMYRDIDLSLEGYFGLESHMWACGLGETSMHYFKLLKDSVAYVFTGSKSFSLCLFGTFAGYQSGLSSTGSFKLISRDTIKATYSIEAIATDTVPREFVLLKKERVTFYYVKNGWEFRTHQNNPWFAAQHLDMFIPENYVLYRLSQIKKNGTRQQRKILKDFVYKKPENVWEHR